MGGNTQTSQSGRQGSAGNTASGERAENGERTADSAGSIEAESTTDGETVHQPQPERKGLEQTSDVGRKGDSTGVADEARQARIEQFDADRTAEREQTRQAEQATEAVTEETAVPVEETPTEPQASALERVPVDEQGNPIYEAVDAETAWDAIVEQTQGDVAMAQTVADSMVADKKAALDKVKKAKSKGGNTIAEKIAAEQERKNAIIQAETELAQWEAIAGTNKRRAEEAEAIAKAEAEAVRQQKEAEQQAKAEDQNYDNQGNPIDAEGNLIVEEVTSIDEITDEDFTNPTRSIQLPQLPNNVSDAIGANGRRVVIKKNVFGKNLKSHKDLTPEDSRKIITTALYTPNLYGQNQKQNRPYNWILIHLADKNTCVLVEVNHGKDNIEVINWHYIGESQLKQKERQAEREGGRILTLSENNAVGNTSHGLSSNSKDTTSSQNNNELEAENVQTTIGEQVQAAEAEVNTAPTDKQKEAGNYKKGHVQIGTFNVTIEQPRGSVRSGVDKGGKKWEVEMKNTYGYIRGTEGVDGDHIDVFLADDIDSWDGSKVFVVDQYNEDGTFDEHKVMLGFNDINEAEEDYLSNYEQGWQGLGAITGVSIEDFEKWIASSHRKTKAFAEYKSVKTTAEAVEAENVQSAEAQEEARRKPLRERISQWSKKTGVKVNFIEKFEDVKHKAPKEAIAEGKIVDGWFDKETGEVYFYMPHLSDAKNADLTFVHEVVAHKGMEALLGKKGYDALCDAVWNSMSEKARKTFENYPGVSNIKNPIKRRRAAADEYIAHLAEKTDLTKAEKLIWSKIVDFIREALEALGMHMKVSDAELSMLIRAAYAKMVQEAKKNANVAEESEVKVEAEKAQDEKTEKSHQFEIYNRELSAIQERHNTRKRPPMPGKLIEAYSTNDQSAIEDWEQRWSDYLQGLVVMDMPEIESTIRNIKKQGRVRGADGKINKQSPIYKAHNYIANTLMKRATALKKEATEEELEAIDIVNKVWKGDIRFSAKRKSRATEIDEANFHQTKQEVNREIDIATGLFIPGGAKRARAIRQQKERERKALATEIYSKVLAGDFNPLTLQQIEKYINDVTPRNPFGRRISQRVPQKVERSVYGGKSKGAVDLLFSRICESSVAASRRNSEEGRREIEERKKEALKGWAIATGNWHTDLSEFTNDKEPFAQGADSKVYTSKYGGYVIKASKGKPYGKRFRADIDNVALFNHIFPNSKYDIVGYGEIDGNFVRILRQPFVDFSQSDILTEEERVAYMAELGFKPLNKENTAFSNGDFVVADLQKANIVRDVTGNIRVIDADVKLHTTDTGGNYSYAPVENDIKIEEDSNDQDISFSIVDAVEEMVEDAKGANEELDEIAEEEAKYAEMDSTIEAADDISNTEEDDDVLYRDGEYLNFKAKYNLVGAVATAVIESEEDLLKLKNLIDEVAYAALENDYNKPYMYGGAYLQHNFIAIYTNKPTAPNPNLVWWHEQTHIAYERINLEDKHECGLTALEWLREQPWEGCRHYDIIIDRYKQEDWDSEASARLVEYIIEKYGVERFLSSDFGGNEKLSKLVTAIKNQIIYGKERPTEYDILRGAERTQRTQDADSRRNREGSSPNRNRPNIQSKSEQRGSREDSKGDSGNVRDIAERQGSGVISDEGVTMASDPVSKAIGEPRYGRGKKMREYAERQRRFMVQKVQEIAQKLNLDNVEIITDASTLSGKRAKAKGYFNPTTGKIVIVIPNHASVLDVEETVLHEAVAHYGLRKLFGKHFDTFLDNVYESADPEIRKKIAALAAKNG